MKKAILYLNQLFGQIGGEDKADFEPVLEKKPIGSANLFNSIAQNVKIEETLICAPTTWPHIPMRQWNDA